MTQWRTQTSTFIQSAPIDTSADFFQTGLFIGKDGTKLYHSDANNLIYEYDLTTAYDISTMSSTFTQSFDPSPQFAGGEGSRSMWFTPDGLKMFVLATFRVYEYNLSTAWNVTTAVFSQLKNLSFQDNNMTSIYFREDGLLMFTLGKGTSMEGSDDRVYKYDLTTPYDLSSATFTSIGGSFHVTENQPNGLFFEDNGLRMYILGAEGVFGDTLWEYPLTVPWDITTTTAPSELDIEPQDTGVIGLHFLNTDPNGGAKFWHGGQQNDRIYEYAMEQIGLEHEFKVGAKLVNEVIEWDVNAKVVNRFDTGDALKIGARLVLFCDNVDTNAGWIQTDPNNQIFVDEGGFPDRIHFERVPAGGGATRRWVAKDSGKLASGDVKFEFKFDLLDDNPTLNFSGSCTVLLADSFNHQNEAQAVGRSYIGFTLTRVRSEGRHIFFGRVSDGITNVTTIEGGSENQHTHEVYKQTSGGTDIQKGPYYCTIELKDNLLRTSIYLDSARTQHMRGSPREADATGIIPTSLQHIIVSNQLGGGSAREVTADFDEFCFTQNEPLQIIPEKPFPAFGQFIDGWETYTLGEQDPDSWVTISSESGATSTVDIDIQEVSNEEPEEGTQAYKIHKKHTQTGGGSTTDLSLIQRTVGPAVVNTDGSGIDLARFLTARQKADIISGAFNGRKTGVTIVFQTLSGGPGIGQMQLGLFGQGGNLFGSNSLRLNEDNPLGTYAGFERFDLKSLLDSDSFLSNNQGADWENHVKNVIIRIGSQTRSDGVGQVGEALIHNDYVSLWGTKLETFLVDAVLKVVDKEHEFIVGKLIALPPNVVQFEIKAGKLLKALGDNGDCNNQRNCSEINAIIVLREDDLFFSTTHLQDIVPLFSEEAPLIQEHEFKVSAKVVIRQTQNGLIVNAFLKRLGDNLCVGETGVFFQDNFTGNGNGAGNIGWDVDDFRIRIDIFGFNNIMRLVNLTSTAQPGGVKRAVKAFSKPFSPDIDFFWEFKHVHFGGGTNFASEAQMTLKETSNDIIPGPNADETTIKYRTDVSASTGPESIILEVFDKNAVNSVFSPVVMTIRDNGIAGFTFYPRITKTGNIIKLEMFIDEQRTTLASVGVAGGLISGVPVTQVDVTGLDMSQDLGFISVGNYASGGQARQSNEEFDDILVYDSLCPRFRVDSLLKKTDIEEFVVKALLKGPRQVDSEVNAILKSLGQEHEFIVGKLIGGFNTVESEVHALLKKLGDNGSCALGQGNQQFCPHVDAFIQQQGVITPESEPRVDAILVITILAKDEEFEVNAVIGLGEGFESVLDVESVIGNKTGSQT